MTVPTERPTRPALRTSTGGPYARVMGIGSYRPRRVVDNDEICTLIDSSDEWIRTRSGIRERRWASPDETVQMMSVSAARMAIERAGLDPAQIDTVIVATVSHLLQTPSAAATIAAELGTKGAAFDVSAACAGFCYGLTLADSLVRTGASTYALVIGVERLSDITSHEDRSSAFIFADGAGAAVVGPSDLPAIGPVVWGSDGDQSGLITQSEPWDRAMAGEPPQWPVMTMDGNPVFKWAAFTMAKAAAETLDGPASPLTRSRSSSRTRRTCGSPTPCCVPSSYPPRSWSVATSSGTATPQPPPSRSRSIRCSPPARLAAARPAWSSASVRAWCMPVR